MTWQNAGRVLGMAGPCQSARLKNRPRSDRGTSRYVQSSASCGTGKAPSGAASRNSRSARTPVDRQSPNRGVKRRKLLVKDEIARLQALIADPKHTTVQTERIVATATR